MNYDVVLSMDAVNDVLRITMASVAKSEVVNAAKEIQKALRSDPASAGEHLREGLYFIDRDPLRGFFTIDVDDMLVEIVNVKQIGFVSAEESMPVRGLVGRSHLLKSRRLGLVIMADGTGQSYFSTHQTRRAGGISAASLSAAERRLQVAPGKTGEPRRARRSPGFGVPYSPTPAAATGSIPLG